MTATTIEWTDHSINTIRARSRDGKVGHYCEKVSPGCLNCYSSTFQKRFQMPTFGGRKKYTDGPQQIAADVVRINDDIEVWFDDSKLEEVLRRRKPTKYFWCDMTDLFGEWVPLEWQHKCFATMGLTPQHSHQILTKRPERMAEYLTRNAIGFDGAIVRNAAHEGVYRQIQSMCPDHSNGIAWPLPNVWLGTSVENQATADERIPHLLRCPAAVRFLSCEPLLEEVDVGLQSATCSCCPRWPSRWVKLKRPVGPDLPGLINHPDNVADVGIYRAESNKHGALSVQTPYGLLGIKPSEFECLPAVDWVIVGGESRGQMAGRFQDGYEDAARSLMHQCRAAGVPFFHKQMPINGRISHDMTKWPEDLRVREMPAMNAKEPTDAE